MFRIVISLCISIALTACANTVYLARPETLDASGQYTHNPSGMIFPITAGDFKRNTINLNDPEGLAVSVGYDLSQTPVIVTATVDVYPSGPVRSADSTPDGVETAKTTWCQNEFDTRKEEIIVAYPASQLLTQNDVVVRQGRNEVPGKSATFEYEGTLDGNRQPLRSRLDVFCYLDDEWTLRYHFTYPATLNANQVMNTFMESLQSP